ncbi:MAG TPA: DUF58 domain-containing protein [Candidatus Limnocylindrales bacterium]|nr:DUF58 domain-containing protein [Candidatus Limnocylindrales bacterium]
MGAAFGRPEPIILATPLLVAALAGLLLGKEPEVEVDLSLSRDRVLEGESVDLDVRLGAARSVPWLELALALPPAVATAEPAAVRGLTLEPDSGVRLSIPILAQRWGAHRVGPAVLRMRDELGFFAFERALDPGPILRVFPRSEEVRRAIPIGQTNASFGNQVSRASGDGIEFATARAYRPGDSVRRVNWRLSNRKSELHVNEMHPERSTDVVVLLDTFTDVVTPAGSSSLAAAIRGAHGIADHFLRRRDRVGLITFGATTRWLVPGMGLRQSYRLVDALLDAQAAVSFAWKGVDLIPPGSLPPRALVVALSPLVDERAVGALFDLRRRRFDVAIIEVDPEGFAELPTDPLASQALRLWRLQRAMRRDEFRSIGVAVARWAAPEPLEAALEEVRAFRRTGRLVSA